MFSLTKRLIPSFKALQPSLKYNFSSITNSIPPLGIKSAELDKDQQKSSTIRPSKPVENKDKFVLVFTSHPTDMGLKTADEEIDAHVRYIQEILKHPKAANEKFVNIKNWSGFDFDRGNYTWRHSLRRYSRSTTVQLLVNEFRRREVPHEIIKKLIKAEEYLGIVYNSSTLPHDQAVQELEKAWNSFDLNKRHTEIAEDLDKFDASGKLTELFNNVGFIYPRHQLRVSSSYLDGGNKEGEAKLERLLKIISKLRYTGGISQIIIAEYQDEHHLKSLYEKLARNEVYIKDTDIVPLIESGNFLLTHEKKAAELKKKYPEYQGDMYACSDTMKLDGPGKTVANMCKIALLARQLKHNFIFYGLGTTPFRSNGANHFYVRDLFSIVRTLTANGGDNIYIMATVQGGHLHDLLEHSEEFLGRMQNTWDQVAPFKYSQTEMLDFYNEFEVLSNVFHQSYLKIFTNNESFISLLRKEDGEATLLGVILGYSGTGSRQKQNIEIRDSQMFWKGSNLRAIDFQYVFRLLGLGSGFSDLAFITEETKKMIEESLRKGNPITKLYIYLLQCGAAELNLEYLKNYDELKTHPTVQGILKGIENFKSLSLEGLRKVDIQHLYEAGYFTKIPNPEEKEKALLNLIKIAKEMKNEELDGETMTKYEVLLKNAHSAFVLAQGVGSKAGVKA